MESNDTDHVSCLSFGIYLNSIMHVTATSDSLDLSNSGTELTYSTLKSFTLQMCISIEEENILLYISVDKFVSRSVCDECKIILMPLIN